MKDANRYLVGYIVSWVRRRVGVIYRIETNTKGTRASGNSTYY